MTTGFNAIICRYHEIAIKGHNRNMFEQKMVDNIRYLLRRVENIQVKKVRGRIWVQRKEMAPFTAEDMAEIHARMKMAFGLESYSPAIMTPPDIEALKNAVKNSAEPYFSEQFAKHRVVSFRIRASRSDKEFPMRSKDIEITLATLVGEMFAEDRLQINLDEAMVTVGCEVRREFAIIFYRSYSCPGGLPVGSSSPVLALLSGGIDSPVACYMMMRRGCPIDYITYHSAPYTPPETTDKVRKMGALLNELQRPGKLFSCNLAEIQKAIRDNCRPDFRTVLYRRMMLRIAAKIAAKNGNRALLTGESVGQVASQTIINMSVINEATEMLVLRPLVGIDKNETIRMAREIGTMDLSNVQVPDSCTVFAPPSPATAAPLYKVLEEEKRLGDWEAILDQIVATAEVF